VRETGPREQINFVFDDNKKEFRDALTSHFRLLPRLCPVRRDNIDGD